MNEARHPGSAGRVLVFTIALAIGLFLVLFPTALPRIALDTGSTATQTVRSPQDISYQSEILTQRQRDQAAAKVLPRLIFDPGVRTRQSQRLDEVLGAITTIRLSSLDATQRSGALTSLQGVQLSPRAAVLALALTDPEWGLVQTEARAAISTAMDGTIPPDGVSAARDSLYERTNARLGEGIGIIVKAIAGALLVPNQLVDQAATARARDDAGGAVPAVTVTIALGEIILRPGDTIDSADIEKLEELGLISGTIQANDIAPAAILSLLSAAVIGSYLAGARPLVLAKRRRLALLGGVMLLSVAVARLGVLAFFPDNDRLFLFYALPLALGPVLVAVLLDISLGLVVAALSAAMAGFVAYSRPEATAMLAARPQDALQMVAAVLFAGAVGALATHRASRVNHFLLAGALIAGTTVAAITGLWLLDPAGEREDLAWIAGVGLASGMITAFLSLQTFTAVGSVFGVTTRMRLIELSQLDQPLLRRLRELTPGTFHHSIIVSMLAEQAADAIGADGLLVRVGCFYHDIGKTLQPAFYIENQGGGGNPHDDLDPAESARLIREHVRGGLELARRDRLPDSVAAFIPEHHGSRLITYFYRKALERDPGIDTELFRYDGPKPQTWETAIVMLADSSEAVVRSSRDRSPERIHTLVDGVIAERLAEGELDESDLTLRDIAAIAASFKRTLRGVYHPRIEYPVASAEQERAAEAARQMEAPVIPIDGITGPPIGERRGY
ncbi:MAG: HDIG domain-containing protein [Dehalococcoidia bacterium]|nr:HDIG domain-containing protein [Dehalococcoidia bacterium]